MPSVEWALSMLPRARATARPPRSRRDGRATRHQRCGRRGYRTRLNRPDARSSIEFTLEQLILARSHCTCYNHYCYLRYFSSPFQAIMTPLSVQYLGGGNTTRTPISDPTLSSDLRIVEFEATPPDATRVRCCGDSGPQSPSSSAKSMPRCTLMQMCLAMAC